MRSSLSLFLAKIALFVGLGVLSSGLVTLAFTNLSTNGGGGGSVGATPNLNQVTTAGNTTGNSITTGGLVVNGTSSITGKASFGTLPYTADGRQWAFGESVSNFTASPSIYSFLKENAVASSSANYAGTIQGFTSQFGTPVGNTATYGGLSGEQLNVSHRGSGAVPLILGFNSVVGNYGSGITAETDSVTGVAYHSGSGTTTAMYGLVALTGNISSTGGKVVTNTGVWIGNEGSGSITTNYGAYITDQRMIGSTNYAIYSEGGNVNLLNTTLTVGGNILPVTNNSMNLGSATLGLAGVYSSGTVMANTPSGSATNAFVSATSGSATLPAYSFSSSPSTGMWLSNSNVLAFQSGALTKLQVSANIITSTNFVPNSTDALDIGVNGNAFKNIYASGTTITFSGVPENTGALANVCITAAGVLQKDSTLACLTSNPAWKNNLTDLKMDGLKVISELQPKEWDWKPGIRDGGHDIGFDAEQAAKVDERLIARMEDGTVKGFRYQEFTSVLVKAIQEILAKVTGIEDRLNQQQHEIDDLRAQIYAFKK